MDRCPSPALLAGVCRRRTSRRVSSRAVGCECRTTDVRANRAVVEAPAPVCLYAERLERAVQLVVVLEDPRRLGADRVERETAANHFMDEERKDPTVPVFTLCPKNHHAK